MQYHQAVSRLSQEMADYKAQHVAVTNEQYNALQHNHAAAMQARRLNMLMHLAGLTLVSPLEGLCDPCLSAKC